MHLSDHDNTICYGKFMMILDVLLEICWEKLRELQCLYLFLKIPLSTPFIFKSTKQCAKTKQAQTTMLAMEQIED